MSKKNRSSSKPGKWISLEDAVKVIMASRNCTHEDAMNVLAFAVQGQKVRAKKTAQNASPQLVPPSEAAALFQAGSDRVWMPLSYFVNDFGMSPEDVHAELKSGRLIAHSSVDVQFTAMIGDPVSFDQFRVTAKSMQEWLHHPETPPRLIQQMTEALRERDSDRPKQDVVVRITGPTAKH